MNFAITGIYACLLALLMMVLAVRVIRLRGKLGISLLDGGSTELAERIRMHANLTETVPMALILMGIAEAQGAGPILLNAIGLILLAGRVVHPLGIVFDRPAAPMRPIGMSATLISMLIAIAYILWQAIA